MSTREILSDEEAAALRATAVPGSAMGPVPEGQVVDLHADHWERIASDRIPALESISERMTGLLKITTRKFFRQSVEVCSTHAPKLNQVLLLIMLLYQV